MPQTARPSECPGCGHDRVARRPQSLLAEARNARSGITEWICPLCSYTWSRPRTAPRPPLPEP